MLLFLTILKVTMCLVLLMDTPISLFCEEKNLTYVKNKS